MIQLEIFSVYRTKRAASRHKILMAISAQFIDVQASKYDENGDRQGDLVRS